MRMRMRVTGFTFIEVLVAVMILAIVATGAVATWGISSRAPANKRVTDIASIVAMHEIELVKARKYGNVQDGTIVSWYDKFGGYISSVATAPSNAVYKASTTISVVVDREFENTGTHVVNTEDLREVAVTVYNAAGTKTYDAQQRTLMAFLAF